MNDPESVPFPYDPKPIAFKSTSVRVFSKEGVSRTIDPHAWITNGTIRPIERGLPLLFGTNDYRSVTEANEFMDKAISKTEDALKNIANEIDDDDNFMQQNKEAEDQQEKQREQKEKERMNRKRRNTTGILPSEETGDILTNIGKINFRSVRRIIHKPDNEQPFPARPKTLMYNAEAESTVPLIREEMKESFKYGQPPFSGIETEDDFPMDGFIRPDSIPSPAKTPHANIDDIDDLDMETPSLLVDPHKDDIFWTRSRAPFTRQEVDIMYTMRTQGDLRTKRLQNRFEKEMKRRSECLKTTFKSKAAFTKRIELLEEDLDRITNIGPGKGERPKESFWVTASKLADTDITSLPYRKNKWKRFVDFVACHGYITTDSQQNAAMNYRELLLKGIPADVNMFWEWMNKLNQEDYVVTLTMLMVEFLRADFGLTSSNVIQYLEERKINTYFYKEAINICKESSKNKAVKKVITIDNEHCDPETLQQLGIWEKPKIKFQIPKRLPQPEKKLKKRVRISTQF